MTVQVLDHPEALPPAVTTPVAPVALVVACPDDPLPPESVLEAAPGEELLVVLAAGHALDVEALAAVERGVVEQAAPLVVVLGHQGCRQQAGCSLEALEHAERTAQLLLELSTTLDAAVARGDCLVMAAAHRPDARLGERHLQVREVRGDPSRLLAG